MVLSLDHLTCQAPLNIRGYIPLHTLKLLAKSQIPIHLGGSRVYQKYGLVCLLQHSLSNTTKIRYPNPTTLGQKSTIVTGKHVNLAPDPLLFPILLLEPLGMWLPIQI